MGIIILIIHRVQRAIRIQNIMEIQEATIRVLDIIQMQEVIIRIQDTARIQDIHPYNNMITVSQKNSRLTDIHMLAVITTLIIHSRITMKRSIRDSEGERRAQVHLTQVRAHFLRRL